MVAQFVLDALLSVAIVTIVPLLMVLFLIPEHVPHWQLMILVSFAVGTLLGDVFLHILPLVYQSHAHASHSHNHNGHDHGDGGILCLAGLLVFIMMDKFIKSFAHDHCHEQNHSHGHTDTQNHTHDNNETHEHVLTLEHGDAPSTANLVKRSTSTRSASKAAPIPSTSKARRVEISAPAYLTLLANLTHVMTDGLVLAMAHATSQSVGYSTTLAIFLHEVPHKIGDYAILIKSGVTPRNAFLIQVGLSMGTVVGCVIGCMSIHFSAVINQIIPITAGGLLYTAMVGLMPDVLNQPYPLFMLEIVSMMLGIAVMAAVTLFE